MKIPIMDGWFRRKRKVFLLIDPNSNCNLHCLHCYRNVFSPDGNGSMSLRQVRILEREVFPYVDKISLGITAETLVYRHLRAILEACVRTGISFSAVQTNGVLLTAEKSKMLMDTGLSHIGFSWDAATKKTFEMIRRGASWETMVRNVKSFIRVRDSHPTNRAWVTFNFAMMKQNAHEAIEFIGLAKQMGADSINFHHLLVEAPEMRGWSLSQDSISSNWLSAALRSETEKLGIPARIPVDLPEKMKPFNGPFLKNPCYYGPCTAANENWVFVMGNGNCYPCMNLQDSRLLGNVFETPFKEIWKSYENQYFRRRALQKNIVEGCDHCKDCAFTDDFGSEMAFLSKRLTTRSTAEKGPGSEAAARREGWIMAG